MIPLGQGVKYAVGAKNKIALLVDPAQRVIGIIAMTTSTVVLTLLKEHPPLYDILSSCFNEVATFDCHGWSRETEFWCG